MTTHLSQPIRVAHRAGNSHAHLAKALAAGVDWIDVDVWLHRGRLIVRHDRPLWRLPITYSRRSIALHLAPAISLDAVLQATARTPTRVLIDLKGPATALPAALVAALCQSEAFARTALCSQDWALLDRARALDPRLQVIYSLGTAEQLQDYLVRRRDRAAPPTTSCLHRLLTPARVAALKAVGSTIIAWTVDTEVRAHDLLAWGVDGITSNRFALLQRVHAPARPR
jgi:glycerophosphoryl diester phosphodiesterase